MKPEYWVALIGALATIAAALIALIPQLRRRTKSTEETTEQSARPSSPSVRETPTAEKISTHSSTPAKTYRRLIGREIELDRVMSALRDPKRRNILLTGLGGIGKTSLAREAVDKSQSESLFEYIVWTSAKTEQFVGERVQEILTSDLTFGGLVEEIARQVGNEDIPGMKPREREAAVRALLAATRVLIVVDNLDTVPNSEELVSSLNSMLGKSKALCTGREGLKNEEIYTIHLDGLDMEAGRGFLRDEASTRNVEIVANASNEILNRIHAVTGGAPLAMRLIVGQLGRQPFEEVLAAMERVSFEGQNYDFYRYVYQKSWLILDGDSQKALVSMAIFPPLTGGAVESVREVVGMNSSDFGTAMDRLVMLSLVDKTGSAGRERFALHPLTQYFVLSDIVNKWSDE